MKVYDSVNKTEVEVDGTQGLIDIMVSGRQVDIYLKGEKSDADGYLTWDVEHWSSIDKQRFIRSLFLQRKGSDRVYRTQHLRFTERLQARRGREDRVKLI